MKKINHKSNKKRNLLIIIGLISSCLLITYLRHAGIINIYSSKPVAVSTNSGTNNSASNNKIDYSPASTADNSQTTNKKESGSPSSTPSSPAISASIVLNRATDVSSAVQLRATIEGVKSGTCIGHLKSRGDSTIDITSTTTVMYQETSSSYTCGNLDITKSNSGNLSWYAYVTLEIGGQTFKSNELSSSQ